MKHSDHKNKADYDKCKPHFDKLISKGIPSCTQIAKGTDISYSRVLTLFSAYCRDYAADKRGKTETIKVVFKHPNNKITTYSDKNEIIDRLSGKYSKKLYETIKRLSDEKTLWNGF